MARAAILVCCVWALWFPTLSPAQDQVPANPEGIFVISPERVLREIRIGRLLRQTESELSQKLQEQIAAAKSVLAAEEEELARIRSSLPDDEFERRAVDFDRRLRGTRRSVEQREAQLKVAFREAAARIRERMSEQIEKVRRASGARIILNADQVIVADPALDLTDQLIATFDRSVTEFEMPQIDFSQPVLQPARVAEPAEEAPAE